MSAPVLKFIDDPDVVVDNSIDALCMTNPYVQRIANTNVVCSKSVADPNKVLLLCGGGSGHEPAHAGFVAPGWLSAIVCGSVFASPPTAHVSAAIERLDELQMHSKAGILVIIKNYAGDIFNFEFAVRQARAKGINVETVLAADDAIFGTKETGKRRGVAGCCLLYKILGAAASSGMKLPELITLSERISTHMRSIGASLSSCSLPGCPPSSTLPNNTVEIGLGIHGEKGLVQVPFVNAQKLTVQLIHLLLGHHKPITDAPTQLNTSTTPIPAHAKMILLVNNLGGCTDMEMNVITKHALQTLHAQEMNVIGVHSGRYMTALDMHGFSLTLLQVTEPNDLPFILNTQKLQKPLMEFTQPNYNPNEVSGPRTALQLAQDLYHSTHKHTLSQKTDNNHLAQNTLYRAIKGVFEKLCTTEAYFNQLDAEVGDGDLGSGVHRAALAVLPMLPYLPYEQDIKQTFVLISKAVADACAGTSGPLYGALLIAAGTGASDKWKEIQSNRNHVHDASQSANSKECDQVNVIRAAIANASIEVQKLGKAHKGDRTMVDVLETLRTSECVNSAQNIQDLIKACMTEARRASDEAAQLPAKFGRSRYMGGKEIGKLDPGCELIVTWINEIARVLKVVNNNSHVKQSEKKPNKL